MNTRQGVCQSPLKLMGAVTDGERTRRYYATSSSSSHELKWVELATETKCDNSSANHKVFEQLFQLLKNISELMLSESVQTELVQHLVRTCTLEEDTKDSILKYSKDGYLLLNLIYCNQELVKLLLQEVCHSGSMSSTNKGSKQLMEVMKYLKFHCSDFSCWKRPLIDVLSTTENDHPMMFADIVYSEFLYELLNIICTNEMNTINGKTSPLKDNKNLKEFVSEGQFICRLTNTL